MRHDMNRLFDARIAMEPRLPASRRKVDDDAVVEAVKALAKQIEDRSRRSPRVGEAVRASSPRCARPSANSRI
ncbi:MAG TPA: hypothetical protein VJQ61_12640 [Sinomonas sp.]|nr:hypothetical protein [Sinomonas sp.]